MINKNLIKKIIKESLGIIYYYAYKKYMSNVGNRCLIYHAFGSKLKHDTYGISITMGKFREHIKYLSDNYMFKKVHEKVGENLCISISIDDGYICTIDAIDFLNKYNIPVTLFVTIETLNKIQYLTTKDLIDISKLPNVTIGCHGYTHKKLSNMTYNEQYIELKKSKEELSELIGKEVDGLSFPHGLFNNDTLNILSKLKYIYAATSIKGTNTLDTSMYKLCRNEVISTDSLNDLQKKINGYYEYY